MDFFLIYFGIGIAVYCALLLLFRKTAVDRKGLNVLWWGWLMSGELVGLLVGLLLWPLTALLSLLWWLGDNCHLKAQRRDAKEREERLKHANKYSHLSMDELVAAQQRTMSESEDSKRKENHAA